MTAAGIEKELEVCEDIIAAHGAFRAAVEHRVP